MKIIKLSSSNVKRLSAVEITPEGHMVTIGGKNGAGKSSVLDSISMALGGDKLVPKTPIRSGQAKGQVKIDLGDYIITRRFNRTPIRKCDCEQGVKESDVKKHASDCIFQKPPTWGPTRSTLTVSSPDGAKYPSPQTLLDGLYGRLSFDPLAFSREHPAKQATILRELTGLDFTTIDKVRNEIFARRRDTKLALGVQEIRLGTIPNPLDTPKALILVTEFTDALTRASELRKKADQAEAALHSNAVERIAKNEQIDGLERQIKQLQAQHGKLTQAVLKVRQAGDKLKKVAVAARENVPDVDQLNTGLKAREAQNEKVRQHEAYTVLEAEVEEIRTDVEEATERIRLLDAKKKSSIQAAKFPVGGLGLEDGGVTFKGLPLEEVASSVQLRVSIAIGIALNPTLKVLLIRNGNLLDEDSMTLVAAQAKKADAQVWMEYVTDNAEGVSVMLEDGHIQEVDNAG